MSSLGVWRSRLCLPSVRRRRVWYDVATRQRLDHLSPTDNSLLDARMTGYASFQCVAFLAGFAPTPDASGLWNRAFPGVPYSSFRKPGAGVSAVEGVVGGLHFEIQLQSGRVDLIAKPVPLTEGSMAMADALEQLSQPAIASLQDVVEGCALTRISAVSVKLTAVNGLAGARPVLTGKVPGLPITGDATDVSFQLNITKQSAVQNGLTMNRLCRWSTSFSFEVEIKVLPNGQTVQTPGRMSHFVEEFFDVNTNADQRVDAAKIPDLFNELIAETKQIAERGIAHLVD